MLPSSLRAPLLVYSVEPYQLTCTGNYFPILLLEAAGSALVRAPEITPPKERAKHLERLGNIKTSVRVSCW